MTIEDKVWNAVETLRAKFPGINAIRPRWEFDGKEGADGLWLGDAAEGGHIDGEAAADYQRFGDDEWEFGVNPKLAEALEELGYYAEWYDCGTLMAYAL